MKNRSISLGALVAAASLFLSACGGGGTKYPVPAAEATAMLAGLGTSPAVAPMPAALPDVEVVFESLPGGTSVQWAFTRQGEDLGKILATVAPDGDAASKVTIDYVDAVGPIATPVTTKYRDQIKGNVRQLVGEAVDSTLDRRPFDMALRKQVDDNITVAMIGPVFQDIGSKIREADAKQAKLDRERAEEPDYIIEPANPRGASAPTTDLRRFNN